MMEIKNLKIECGDKFRLEELNYRIEKGSITAIVGESGSGKSTLGKALVGLYDSNVKLEGQLIFKGRDIYSLKEDELRQLRREKISICLQNNRDILNPLMTVEDHVFEVIREKNYEKLHRWLELVGLKREVLGKYPSQISGGERQKLLLILCLIIEPEFLVLDEPTSSLDRKSKERIVDLIRDINRQQSTTIVFISHDLDIVEALEGNMLVMYGGQVVEIGEIDQVLKSPAHSYTRGLINSSLALNPYKDIWGIRNDRNNPEGCPFYYRCNQSLESCKKFQPRLEEHSQYENRLISCNRGGIINILRVDSLSSKIDSNYIVKDISLKVDAGEIVALIGDSGIGKTTLLKTIGGFMEPAEGQLSFYSEEMDHRRAYNTRGGLQFIFQDANSALNSEFTVGQAMEEAARLNKMPVDQDRLYGILDNLGLDRSIVNSRIGQLSGGEKQRVALGRGLLMEPSLLLADEPTSMLDPSNKANILRLLKSLQNIYGFSMLIVSHDIYEAAKISDRILRLTKEGIEEYRGREIVGLL